jgi:hypothetical protein
MMITLSKLSRFTLALRAILWGCLQTSYVPSRRVSIEGGLNRLTLCHLGSSLTFKTGALQLSL